MTIEHRTEEEGLSLMELGALMVVVERGQISECRTRHPIGTTYWKWKEWQGNIINLRRETGNDDDA